MCLLSAQIYTHTCGLVQVVPKSTLRTSRIKSWDNSFTILFKMLCFACKVFISLGFLYIFIGSVRKRKFKRFLFVCHKVSTTTSTKQRFANLIHKQM